MDTSYESIWAQERKEPKKAYLELLAQPAKIILYTDNEEIANQTNKLKLKSISTLLKLKGIKDQDKKLRNKPKNGAIIKRLE